MKCLIKYKWIKLPRELEIDAKGLMTYYIRLVTRAAFRKGTAHYCGFENHVEPGMWAGGIVGLKSILGVKKRLVALWIMNQLEDLGYLTWTLEPKTKLLTYKITDWVTTCSGAPCEEGAVYASTGYGFIGIPRNITQRLVDKGYKFEPGDAFLDLWCHTVYRDYGNAFSFLAPDVQYEKYGSVLTLEMLGKRWGWEKTKVCRFFKKYEEYFKLYRLPASYGCVIFNQCYPTEDRVTMPSQEQVVSIFKEILIRARNTHAEGTQNEKLNRFVAWLSRRLMKAWEESVQNQSDSETEAENQSGMGVLKASVAFLAPIIRAYISHGRNYKHTEPCFYFARELKRVNDYELNKIRFTRLAGAIVYPGGAYAVYNYREEMLKWMGEGEVKIKHHLHTIFTPMISYEFPLREAAIIFGTNYDVALNMLKEMKETQKMDNGLFHTYKDIFFIPMDDFGARLLRVLTTWNWQERILNALFDPKVRSYNRGSFTYDAHENGEFQFSFLDGNIWRLFRFREAILNREGKLKIICYPEQLTFLRKYMGNLAKFSTVTMENVERVLEIKRKSLL